MLSVHQFVSHLNLESQGAILTSQHSFLEFLRERFVGLSEDCAQVRRDLYAAATAQVQGSRVHVSAMPEEREAAKAVLYAVCKLADRLQARASGQQAVNARKNANRESATRASQAVTEQARAILPVQSDFRVYTDESKRLEGCETRKRWKAGYNGAGGWATRDDLYPRLPFTVTFTANGRETARMNVWADKLEAVLADLKAGRGFSRKYVNAVAAAAIRGEHLEWHVSATKAERLARAMLVQARRVAKRCPKLTANTVLDALPVLEQPRPVRLPVLESHTEVLEVGETLHFKAGSRETGYARVTVDGEEVARVRCWRTVDPEPWIDPLHDRIRGGTIQRVCSPQGARALARNEVRVIELGNGVPGRRGERLVGRGTRAGEVWVRGTADREVMGVYLGRLITRALTRNAAGTNVPGTAPGTIGTA